MKMRPIRVGVACALLLTGISGTAAFADTPTSSNGTVQPNQVICDAGYGYTETHSDTNVPDTSTRTYGQSGGTLLIQQGTAVQTGSSWTVTAGVDVQAVLAKVSASVGLTTSQSSTSTVTTGYTWKVPSSQSTGWLEAGHHGYIVSWKKIYTNQNCGVSTVASGTNTAQTKNISYSHSN